MPRKRPPTKVELDYRRERKRIQNFIRRAQKRGYIFADPKTGNMFELPAIPKKITEASVRRLKKYTPDYLYGKSIRVDAKTGDYEAGPTARKRERSQSAKRSAQTVRRNRERKEREREEQERREREAFERGVREERERQRRIEEQQERERERQRRVEEQEQEYIHADRAILDRTRLEWAKYAHAPEYPRIVIWLNTLIEVRGEAFACDVLAMAESAGVVPGALEFYVEEMADRYIDEMISFVSQRGVDTYGMTADQMEDLGLINWDTFYDSL